MDAAGSKALLRRQLKKDKSPVLVVKNWAFFIEIPAFAGMTGEYKFDKKIGEEYNENIRADEALVFL